MAINFAYWRIIILAILTVNTKGQFPSNDTYFYCAGFNGSPISCEVDQVVGGRPLLGFTNSAPNPFFSRCVHEEGDCLLPAADIARFPDEGYTDHLNMMLNEINQCFWKKDNCRITLNAFAGYRIGEASVCPGDPTGWEETDAVSFLYLIVQNFTCVRASDVVDVCDATTTLTLTPGQSAYVVAPSTYSEGLLTSDTSCQVRISSESDLIVSSLDTNLQSSGDTCDDNMDNVKISLGDGGGGEGQQLCGRMMLEKDMMSSEDVTVTFTVMGNNSIAKYLGFALKITVAGDAGAMTTLTPSPVTSSTASYMTSSILPTTDESNNKRVIIVIAVSISVVVVLLVLALVARCIWKSRGQNANIDSPSI